MDSQLVMYALIGLNILYGLVIVFLFASYLKLLNKDHKQNSEQTEEVKKIMAEANKKTLEMVRKTEFITDDAKKEFNDSLMTVVDEYKKQSQKTLDLVNKELESATKKITKDAFEKALGDTDQMMKTLFEDTRAVKGMITKTASEGLLKIEGELEEYRKIRLSSIEKEVRGRIDELAKALLGKILTTEDHRDLIKQALGQAKEENVL